MHSIKPVLGFIKNSILRGDNKYMKARIKPMVIMHKIIFEGTIPFVYNKSPIEYKVLDNGAIAFKIHLSFYNTSILISPETLRNKILYGNPGFTKLDNISKHEQYILDKFYKTSFDFYRKFHTKRG